MIKKSLMLCVLSMVLCGWGWSVMADQNASDQAENIIPSPGLKAAGDILWHCDVQSMPNDNRIVGLETLRDTIYTTGAGASTTDTLNYVYAWIRSGEMCQYLYGVQQTGSSSWGFRDLAADDQYLYGTADNFPKQLRCFYVTPGGMVNVPANNINVPNLPTGFVIRAVAYDQNNDKFWCKNWGSKIYGFNRSGVMTDSFPDPYAFSVYGLAYDDNTPGGPYLWVHVQDSCNVYQFNLASGAFTGVIYSGWGDDDPGVSGIAGGLCVLEGNPSKGGSVTLLGITQGSPFDEMYAMEIYVAEESLYWKPPYDDYAPSGMPDISQMQALWVKDPTGAHTFCGPCAVANCFQWFDSKYNQFVPGAPGDGFDMFPLVRDYLDGLPPLVGPFQDDHDPYNMDHPATPWMYGGTTAPPPTPQPFIPGPQPPGMPPWGELVERLAWYFNTDGVKTGYCQHNGTEVHDMYQGIQDWFESEHFMDGSTISDTLCVNLWQKPSFALVESLVEKCEDVILLLGFWYYEEGPGEQQFIRGDADANGIINSDDVALISSGGPFPCDDAADVNDDGISNVVDAAYLANYLAGGNPPPAPFPACGIDPTTDGIGCASFPPCPSADQWLRCGGHYVTVAGINSRDYLIAVSDPMFDWAEMGNPGRVLNGQYIPHTPGHDQTVHNDVGNVSHDVYQVIDDPISPGGLWELADYVISQRPWYCDDLSLQNIPNEFVGVSAPWPGGETPVLTEVEYAVQISPWDFRGDINVPGGDGVVDVGDVVYLINYLFKHGPTPDPFIEGDTNCDGIIDIGDVVILINYLFKNGPVPRCCNY